MISLRNPEGSLLSSAVAAPPVSDILWEKFVCMWGLLVVKLYTRRWLFSGPSFLSAICYSAQPCRPPLHLSTVIPGLQVMFLKNRQLSRSIFHPQCRRRIQSQLPAANTCLLDQSSVFTRQSRLHPQAQYIGNSIGILLMIE